MESWPPSVNFISRSECRLLFSNMWLCENFILLSKSALYGLIGWHCDTTRLIGVTLCNYTATTCNQFEPFQYLVNKCSPYARICNFSFHCEWESTWLNQAALFTFVSIFVQFNSVTRLFIYKLQMLHFRHHWPRFTKFDGFVLLILQFRLLTVFSVELCLPNEIRNGLQQFVALLSSFISRMN